MEWKIEEVEVVFLDFGATTTVSIEIKVVLTDGSSIECVLPLLTHPGTKEETKRLVAEHIDPYLIKEYVRSSVETMVEVKSVIGCDPDDGVENYLRFTEGIIYNINPKEEG